jgi:predicted DNA-binding ribbon-helix-helix protein
MPTISPSDSAETGGIAAIGKRSAESSKIVKHSLTIAGHRTSVTLEAVFWDQLKTLSKAKGLSLAALVAAIDAGRGDANLSSALRVFVLEAVLTSSANQPE